MKHNWEYKRLGDLCTIKRGGSPRPIHQFITENPNGINWIKIGDAGESKYITSCKEKIKLEGVLKSRFVHKGDFLLSNSMSFGRPYILGVDGCIHDGWLVLEKPVSFIADFLYYLLGSSTIYHEFSRLARGAVVSNLNVDLVSSVRVPVPPMEVQERIVTELDQINDLISTRKEQIKHLDSLAQSLFYDTFGDPITNPKGWEVKKLLQISTNKGTYGAPSPSTSYSPDRPRYIRITDIDDSGCLNNDFVASANVEDDTNYCLKFGDILFARTGATVGKTYLYNGISPQIYAGYLIKFSLNCKTAVPAFIFQITRTSGYKDWVKQQIIGAAQPNVNAQKYGTLPIILPPLPLQQQFASQVEAIEAQKAVLNESLKELQTLLASRMDYWFN